MYYFPGLLFSNEAKEEIEDRIPPTKLPRNCFAFRFGEQEIITDGKDTFEKPPKWDENLYMIGEKVPFEEIPNIPTNNILRDNIECNSPTKTAIKTHLGTWQAHNRDTIVVPVSKFQFEDRWIRG